MIKLRLPPQLEVAKASTIMADPNWGYQNFGQKKHGAARAHYPGAPVADLAKIPVASMGRPDSILFGWASFTKLAEGVDLYRSWGYHVVTSWPWVKTVPSKEELAQGIGFWTYAQAELLIALRRGKARGPQQSAADKPRGLLVGPTKLEAVFYAARRHHSRKPLSLIEWVESRFPGPFLELFATGARPGWTTLGHETGWHLCEEGAVPLSEARRRGMLKRHAKRAREAGRDVAVASP